jgi:multiple sugar transport system substrate-binding protein
MIIVRRKPDRRVTAALLAVAVLLPALLSGCGGTLPPPDVSRPGFGQDARGTVQLWVRAATQAASAPIVASFNRTHPHLQVKMTAIPDAQYVTKLATAIRGRSVPDVVDMDDINSTLLAYHEALTNLTPLMHRLPYRNRLSPAHRMLATYRGREYGLPFLADISVLYYNKSLFRRAGLDPNAPPRTLPAVLRDAQRINDLGNGVHGFSFGGDSPGIMGFTALPSVWASAADRPFTGSLDRQRAHAAGNPGMRNMLRFYHDVWHRGLCSPSSRTETGATWGKDFLSGKVGMWPGNEGALVAAGVPHSFAGKIGVTPLPGATKGQSVFAGGDNMGIPRGAQNASGAWEYMKYALRVSQQASLPAVGFTPVRADVATPAFTRRYPRTAVVLRALSKVGYAPKTLAYNTAVNQVSGPFFEMFTSAVFHGHVNRALRTGQVGLQRALLQAES